VSFFEAGEPHPGLVIVPWSLPNSEPERIAHALATWQEKTAGATLEYGIFFLAS